ncbi:MAG: 50S ribosomal protein L35 [Candidatus Sungbacteria bacterium]|nr:50S ribosomal protein L35 [Candidatus Sungbacteria bacterium]
MKTRKSILKRIKITGTGKLLRRISRKTHFNAKERRTVQLRGKQTVALFGVLGKKIRQHT